MKMNLELCLVDIEGISPMNWGGSHKQIKFMSKRYKKKFAYYVDEVVTELQCLKCNVMAG